MPDECLFWSVLTVVATAARPETKAFYDTYQHDLEDDNAEFAHMQGLDVDVLYVPGEHGDVEMAAEDDEEEEEAEEVPVQKTVSTRELVKELREASRNNEVCPAIIMICAFAHTIAAH